MQVLTANEIVQLRSTAKAAYAALEIVEDATCEALDRVLCALTSERAIAGYRLAWYVTKNVAEIGWMVGVLAFTLGREWCDRLVESCQSCLEVPYQPVAIPEVVAEAETEADPWDLIAAPRAIAPTLPTLPALPTVYLLPPAQEQEDLTTKTTHELRRLAVANGHKGAGRWNKAKLLAALTA